MSHDRFYVGGGNIAGLVGASPYSSPVLEYLTIVGEAPPPTADELRFFGQRRRREPYILESLEIDHGIALPVRNQRYTDAEHDFLRAEIDAENDELNGELKTVHPRAKDAQTWQRMDEASVPEHVVAQVQWGLMLRPKPLAFAVGEVGYETFPYPIPPDLELQQLLRARAVEFWQRHVLPRVPPEPASEEDVKALYPRSKPSIVVATAEQEQLVRQLAELKKTIKDGELVEAELLSQLKTMLGPSDTLISAAGKVLATWKTNRDSLVCDWQALARDQLGREQLAAAAPKFTTPRIGARPFLIKKLES